MSLPPTEQLTAEGYEQLQQQASAEADFVFLGASGNDGSPGRYQLFSALAHSTISLGNGASLARATGEALAQRMASIMATFLTPWESEQVPFPGGWMGYLSYEFGYNREARLAPLFRPAPCPQFYAGLFLWLACYDREAGTYALYIHPDCAEDTRVKLTQWRAGGTPAQGTDRHWHMHSPFRSLQTAAEFRQRVDTIKGYIEAGDCYQANLSQCFQGHYTGNEWVAFQALSKAHPTPFGAFIRAGGQTILSLSPERFLSIHNGKVSTSPIKGTRPRGKTPREDLALSRELLASNKDRAENLMIVDLLRNDLHRHCRPGSVRVSELFSLESYRNVHHLVSHIEGELADGVVPFQALLDAFPGGSITGAPKIRAMEIIRELEPHWRGPYCGSVFYWGLNGRIDSNIAIRTLLCDDVQSVWCWGGGGIVADSDPHSEYEETLTKVRPLMDFLEAL